MAHNIKYRQVKAFIDLVETGSFKNAADRLCVTQPSLSTLLKELEADLGVTLLTRSTRSMSLTKAGREFYEQVRGSIDQLEKAYSFTKAVGKAESGRLRVATLPSLSPSVVAPAIGKYRQIYPGVQIELMERTYTGFLLALRQKEADIGVGVLKAAEPELAFSPLFEDRLVVVAPAGHPLARRTLSVKSLSDYSVILVAPGPSIDALMELQNGAMPSIQVEQPTTAISMVRLGMGVTVTTSSAIASIEKHGLCCIPVHGSKAVRKVGLITRRGSELAATAAAFAQIMGNLQPFVADI